MVAWEAFYTEATSSPYPTAALGAALEQGDEDPDGPAGFPTAALREWCHRTEAGDRAADANTAPVDVPEPAQDEQPARAGRRRVNRTDDVARWAGLIRTDLEANGGKPSHPRRVADPVTYDTAGDRVYLLRG